MISAIGGTVQFADGTMEVGIPDSCTPDLTGDIAKRMRASVIFTGPLLARFRRVRFPHPGGCVIGPRPIDMFLEAYERMGATVRIEDGSYEVSAPRGLLGASIFFRQQSVTATEAVMLAAALAEGTITIRGTTLLTAREHYRCIPDRIEAGSFLILAALAGKDVCIHNVNCAHIRSLTNELERARVELRYGENSVRVAKSAQSYCPLTLKTHEYPGFPTDLQAPMLVFLTQAGGESLVFETRLNYSEELIRMGADITVMNPHQALVRGPRNLYGRELPSPDIRAGLAFVIAAAIAEGKSLVHNVYYIDRGYERIDERFAALGLSIIRHEFETH